MENIQLEYPINVTGGDGTLLWTGVGVVGTILRGVNSDTANAVAAGQALAWDASGLRIQPWDRTLASGPLQQVPAVKLATTTGNLDTFAGVALTPAVVAPATGTKWAQVFIAGAGSVVPVKSTAAGTVRWNCAPSATAGSITPTSAVPGAPGSHLGRVVKIAGAVGGTTDSGSANYVICAVGGY